jgi:hypothetical protein
MCKMQDEIWKDVPNSSGNYKVSNMGRVLSVRFNRIIATSENNCYIQFCFGRDNITNRRLLESVHVLVAKLFIGERPVGLEVNHINGRKNDNKVSNLEYVTPKENIHHMLKMGLRKPRNGKPIRGVSIEDGSVIEYSSIRFAQRDGFSKGNIFNVIGGLYKQHKGYVWSFQ